MSKKYILTYLFVRDRRANAADKDGGIGYIVKEERAVYLRNDPKVGLIIYGELSNKGKVSGVDLVQVLLEFAMSWKGFKGYSEVSRQMKLFGKRIGEAMADQVARDMPDASTLQHAAHGMESIFRSLNESIEVQQTKYETRYKIAHCPLCLVSDKTGSRKVMVLAHHALNAVSKSLVHNIDPLLQVHLPNGPLDTHLIHIQSPISINH